MGSRLFVQSPCKHCIRCLQIRPPKLPEIRSKLPQIKYGISDLKLLYENAFVRYEEFIGLTEVKTAQENVIQAEANFLSSQKQRETKQAEITALQNKIKEIHGELKTVTDRSEDRYIDLIQQEHQLIKQEKSHLQNFELSERTERENFQQLSAYLRESHEKERLRAERTKYWSIIGSVIGAILGITGTTINNRLRMRELRALVGTAAATTSGETSIPSLENIENTVIQNNEAVLSALQSLGDTLVKNQSSEALKSVQHRPDGKALTSVSSAVSNLLDAMTAQSEIISRNFDDVKRLIVSQSSNLSQSDKTLAFTQSEVTEPGWSGRWLVIGGICGVAVGFGMCGVLVDIVIRGSV